MRTPAAFVFALVFLEAGCSAQPTASVPPRAATRPREVMSTDSPRDLSEIELRALVQRLGTSQDPEPFETMRQLHTAGRTAVELLLRELQPVDPDAWDDRTQHAIWCERALRSLTGRVFRFKTTERLDARQRELLSPDDEIGFFAEWMSRGRLYLAPRDVQEKVIAAWQTWYAERARDFEPRPYRFDDEWYF
jgi:hypothetical protein